MCLRERGDEISDGWCRGTFVGQKYGPFNDIPAVWDHFFGSKGYKALAAGIAGDPTLPHAGMEHLSLSFFAASPSQFRPQHIWAHVPLCAVNGRGRFCTGQVMGLSSCCGG